MKRIVFLTFSLFLIFSNNLLAAEKPFKLGIVIYSNDTETVWNAFRLADFSLSKGDEVKIFLLGKGVEYENLSNKNFDITQQAQSFLSHKGQIFACGSCLKIRQKKGDEFCPVSTLANLYEIIRQSDKVLTF